ncbi:MAG: hypothetical protein NZ750_04150 [Anaerolineae bacterium]|nr:hypothetical protein [Anaerolineae bacterium]MDW8171513.1 hypothetical protein [Anaerolineae bacterium]
MLWNIPPTPFLQRDWLVLLLIVFIAAVLRLGEPQIVEYFHDDAMLATLAREWVTGRSGLPLTGILSSTGIPNPPTSVYLMGLPFALSPDPFVAIVFIMLLNTAGVAVFWAMLHRYAGRDLALVAALTYACSPWAVFYSRKLWAQEFHTPLILLSMGLLWWAAQEKRCGPAVVCALPLLLFALQIHFAAWALLPAFGLVLAWGWRAWPRRALLVGALLALLTLLPYSLGLTQTLQTDPERISAAVARSDAAERLTISPQALIYAAQLLTGYGLEDAIAPNPAQAENLRVSVPFSPLWTLIGLTALLGAAAGLAQHSTRRLTVLALVWGFLPPLLLTLRLTTPHPHYFIACLPAYALLCGLGLTTLWRALPHQQVARNVLLLAYGVILLSQAVAWRGLLRWIESHHIAYPGFTTPLSLLNPIRQALDDKRDVVVLSQGMAWNLDHEVAVWETLLSQAACVRTLRPDGYFVQPVGPFAVLRAPSAPSEAVRGLYDRGQAEIFPERPGGGVYEIRRFAQAPAWDGPPILPVEAPPFQNGPRLLGYGWQDSLLALAWSLPQGRRGDDVQYSAQAFDAAGQRLAQHDARFWQSGHWCAGDTLITYAPLALTDQARRLTVSLYRLLGSSGFETVPLADGSTAVIISLEQP